MQTNFFDTQVYGNPQTDSWYTPDKITVPVRKSFGVDYFDLDPCSYDGQTIADRHYTKETCGLRSVWPNPKTVWVNPPSGKPGKDEKHWHTDLYALLGGKTTRPYTLLFWAKMIQSGAHGAFMAYNTQTLHQAPRTKGDPYSFFSYPILFLSDRVQYERAGSGKGQGPMFHSAIVLVGHFDPEPIDHLGWIHYPPERYRINFD